MVHMRSSQPRALLDVLVVRVVVIAGDRILGGFRAIVTEIAALVGRPEAEISMRTPLELAR
jgi:hypothetical protein